MAKSHPFSGPCLGSRVSPYLQEKLVLLGCEQVYAAVPPLVKELLVIEVSESQVYRTCQAASEALPEEALCRAGAALAGVEAQAQEKVYGLVDGTMLQMESGWQESKVGRVFALREDEAQDLGLRASEYVAHRGHYQEFKAKFEQLLPPQSACEKIFISDGARWIGQWLKESYPEATQILDYFHACQKLAEASEWAPEKDQWFEKQKKDLIEGQHAKVCQAIAALDTSQTKRKETLLAYFKNNSSRMQYHLYREAGLRISSSPIESAHRTVLQVRMKRSGQHWSGKGADNMIKLRVAYRSNKFQLITDLFKNTA